MTEVSEVDYKKTLNLPNTSFPMRANLPQKEPAILAKWAELNLYESLRTQKQGKKKFILHLGPPYANGDIHIGHALTTILKDIIVKSKTLGGFDAPLVPGWDCHGLPIELNVEKKIGLANVDVSPANFRQACREYAASQIALQKASFIRLGICADWEKPYITMDFRYQADIVRSLAKIMSQGYLQQGAKPVHWCTSCASSLAEAEVEYQNKVSPAIDVAFNVVDEAAFLAKISQDPPLTLTNKIAFVIWTTTPWTLPANQAVALHPELDYVLVKVENQPVGAFCLLKALLSECLQRYGCTEYEILATFKGKLLERHLLQHPFYDRQVPIVLGEHVTIDCGTGAVHTAPAHGLEDYMIGSLYHLPMETPVGNNGCFSIQTPDIGGMFVLKANNKIIEILREKHQLIHATTLSHSYPHCWRHKTPLIFLATPQWFISMDSHQLRKKVLAAIEKVKWIPSRGQMRLSSMIEGRPDWCISRQRAWGVPLPLFIHKTDNTLHPQSLEIMEYIANLIEKRGVEAWYEVDAQELPFAGVENYRKSQDILDVWFDSGTSHYCVLKARSELQFPADLYLEGSDQHRGWFQTSLLSSIAMQDEAPYKAVLTHGFTVDATGKKMSKSLGNVVAPDKVIKTLGADILRLWVAATDYKDDVHVSEEILNRMSDAYRRIRNTARFLLANIDGFDPVKHLLTPSEFLALDRWLVDHTARLQDEIIAAYASYQFHAIYQKIHNFCVVELGSFYLDVIKDRQYTLPANSLARHSAQSAMYYLLHALTRWLAPILSFTAEEIWAYLPGENVASVFFSEWVKNLPRLDVTAPMNNAFWQKMIIVRSCVNKALEAQRVQGKLGAPLDANVTLYAEGELYGQLQLLGDELKFILITSGAKVMPLAEKGDAAQATELPALWLHVQPSEYQKCTRCWHHESNVNNNPNYPNLCERCVTNITTVEGEVRQYA